MKTSKSQWLASALLFVTFLSLLSKESSADKEILLKGPERGWYINNGAPSQQIGCWFSYGSNIYSVCDSSVTNREPTNWLRTDFIDVKDGLRVDIVVNYTMRKCKPGEMYCKENFKLYGYQTAKASPNPDPLVTAFDFIAQANPTQVPDRPTGPGDFNLLNVSIKTRSEGLYLGFYDQGACMSILGVTVSFNYCPEKRKHLVTFARTASPFSDSSANPVEGKCSDPHSRNTTALTAVCTSQGNWKMNNRVSCLCQPGYHYSKTPQPHCRAPRLRFLVTPRSLYFVPFRSNFKLDCTTNDPSATTELYHRHSDASTWNLLSLVPSKLVKSGQVYTIIDFDISDIGQYQCRATNALGSTIKWPRVVLLSGGINRMPPLDITPKYAVDLTEGKSYNVTCSSMSSSTLQWFKELNDSSEIAVPNDQIYSERDSRLNKLKVVLMFNNVQKSDTGLYICKMSFRGKSTSRYSALNVYEYELPKILSSSRTSLVINHSNKTTLYCVVYGHPRPDVYWYKDGKQIKIRGCQFSYLKSRCKDRKYQLTYKPITTHTKANASLTILKTIFPDDQGRYTCEAVNSQGKVNKSVDVFVQAKPVLDKSTRLIIKGSKVTCHALQGGPPPKFTWFIQFFWFNPKTKKPDENGWQPISKYGKAAAVSSNGMTSTIKLPRLRTWAFYKCVAVNSVGRDSHTIKVIS